MSYELQPDQCHKSFLPIVLFSKGGQVSSSFKDKTDEELMNAYVYGDIQAFEELYGRYHVAIWNYLRKYLSDESALRDIMQESFFKLHRSREQYDSTKKFRPWLFTICHNTLIDALRKQGRQQEVYRAEQVDEVADTSLSTSPRERPIDEELLRPLKEKDRQIIALRFEQELSYEEVATALGLSQDNTRKILSRSLDKLRHFLGGQHD